MPQRGEPEANSSVLQLYQEVRTQESRISDRRKREREDRSTNMRYVWKLAASIYKLLHLPDLSSRRLCKLSLYKDTPPRDGREKNVSTCSLLPLSKDRLTGIEVWCPSAVHMGGHQKDPMASNISALRCPRAVGE